jgi:hypothetical protein
MEMSPMAIGKQRKTPTTRNKRTLGTTARGQGKNLQTAGRGARATTTNKQLTGTGNITPKMIGTFQQWVRMGQSSGFFPKLYGSTTHQNELQKYQQNRPAGLITGSQRSQRQLAANA